MRPSRVLLLVGIVAAPLATFAVACGLDDGGFGVNPGPGPDGGADRNVPDTNTDAPRDAGIDAPKGCPVREGWTHVAYVTDGGGCASEFETSEGLTAPFTGVGCTCQSCQVTQPDCASVVLHNITYGPTNAVNCGPTLSDITVSANACAPFTETQMGAFKGEARPQQNGTCSRPAQANSGASGQRVRVCTPGDAGMAEPLCAAKSDCIVHEGSLACPADSEYTKQSIIGEKVDVTCSACGCSVSPATCRGTVALYQDAGCTDDADEIDVTNPAICTGIPHGGGTPERYGSLRFVNGQRATEATCVPGADSTPTANAGGRVRTVCCRQ